MEFIFVVMILINKYETAINIDEAFLKYQYQYEELKKIFNFIDLPESIVENEQINSTILRNYYANALDNNLIDVKTVKYILNKNIRPSGANEKAVYQYYLAEQYLFNNTHQPLSLNLIYQVYKILISDLFIPNSESGLFSPNSFNQPEKLHAETELELDNLFEFLNIDTEFHPIIQSWMLHFKILSLPFFNESKNKFASLMQSFWLRKNDMDLNGLLSLEHELYIKKNEYLTYFLENNKNNTNEVHLNEQIAFGLKLHANQLTRLYQLLQTYFRKQVDYDKLTSRQKNIMNFVFERGYKLKEIDDSILNKRQKLIMYIIQHRGFVSTKELVTEFDCNRKTIQRDFVHLLDLNLVKVIGQGSALKYSLNLDNHKNDSVNVYQSNYVKNIDENLAIDFE